jgi:hypothetical protein
MDVGARNSLLLGQSEPGLPAIRGSAAWAQTQLTPGVSVLAAPHPKMRMRRDSAGQQVSRSMTGTLK